MGKQPESNKVANGTLEDQIRECYGKVVYSHKTHMKQAEMDEQTLRRFKIAQIFVSAITTTGAVAVIFQDDVKMKFITALFSLASFIISAYMKGFDPGGTAEKHRTTASELWNVRESYLSLLTDMRSGKSSDVDSMKRRDELQAQLASIYKGEPQTSSKAYEKAQKALKENEESTFNKGEIDALLPASLRK